MKQIALGVIGGSGLYQMEGLVDIEEIAIDTPFGRPSDNIILGTLEGERVAFLPRHGKEHRLLPSEIPVKANIYALKSLGIRWLISVSAVGSLKENLKPLDLIIPDQLIDRTKGRESSFFGQGVVVHIPFAQPFCPNLSRLLYQACRGKEVGVHFGGTYLVIEGPAFSTRAESFLYRSWGADVIGMTALPEARLAREAEICYATLACITDYDCWHEGHEAVTAEMILENLRKNVARSQRILRRLVKLISEKAPPRDCPCPQALKTAIVTSPQAIPQETKERLNLLLAKYL